MKIKNHLGGLDRLKTFGRCIREMRLFHLTRLKDHVAEAIIIRMHLAKQLKLSTFRIVH